MTDLETIVGITGVGRKHWQDFSVTSLGGVNFAGYLCRQESERLGTLALTQVEGRERLEFIAGMPKIPYPYQRDRHDQVSRVFGQVSPRSLARPGVQSTAQMGAPSFTQQKVGDGRSQGGYRTTTGKAESQGTENGGQETRADAPWSPGSDHPIATPEPATILAPDSAKEQTSENPPARFVFTGGSRGAGFDLAGVTFPRSRLSRRFQPPSRLPLHETPARYGFALHVQT